MTKNVCSHIIFLTRYFKLRVLKKVVYLLKKVLDQFEQIGVTNCIRERSGKLIEMHQSVFTKSNRILNGEYIELNDSEDEFFSKSKCYLRNNPQDIQIINGENVESKIVIEYFDGTTITLIGYKKL